MPGISVPTLVLHRAKITTAVVDHGRFLAEHIAGAAFVELPGEDIFYWVGDTRRMLDEIEEFLTGARSTASAERVLATVLFTDIVGSTTIAATMGDSSWRDLLDHHDHAVRQQLARFRGVEVDTVGDGFFARFESPGRGIECAIAIREALGALGIGVRRGLHTGEIELPGRRRRRHGRPHRGEGVGAGRRGRGARVVVCPPARGGIGLFLHRPG